MPISDEHVDNAILENYQFMIDNGETHDTAATRLGTTPEALDKRLWRIKRRRM